MSIGELYDANNVVVGQAAAFFAPEGTPLPALTGWDVTDPFAASFFPAPWTACGATDQGWQFGAEKNTQTINIEEQSTPVGTTITDQSISLSAALSEDISKTLALTLNATKATTAATTTAAGYDELTLQDTPLYYAVALVTTNAEGFGRIVYAPKWTSLENVEVGFRRASDKRNYGAGFATVCKTTDIRIINFITPKLWQATTAYVVGNKVVLSTGEILEATVAGTSAAAEPAPPAVGATVVDGTVTWIRRK